MQTIMWLEYRRGILQEDGSIVYVSVPCPSDGTADKYWMDHTGAQLADFANLGIDGVLTPPLLKAEGGNGEGCDGYEPYDDYDWGNKLQQGSVATRFGTEISYRRFGAVCKANGLGLLIGLVPHHRGGGKDCEYNYLGSDGKTKNGRFPKTKNCFWRYDAKGKLVPGFSKRDNIAGPIADDQGFGDPFAPINSPEQYVLKQLAKAQDAIVRALDADGGRIDDTKGLAFAAVIYMITYGACKGKFWIGEYSDGNRDTLAWYCQQTGYQMSTFDFATYYMLQRMCNNGSKFDVRQLQNFGLKATHPFQAATFAGSPDDNEFHGQQVIWNKLLFYAVTLTSEGCAFVDYQDYAVDEYCYGLKPYIDNLLWIRHFLIGGSTQVLHANYQTMVYRRTDPGAIVGINNDIFGGWKTVTLWDTGYLEGTILHDYTGNNQQDVRVGMWGEITIGIPQNDNGHGYVVYAKRDFIGKKIKVKSGYTTQSFEGALDLPIGPAKIDWQTISTIYCAAESVVTCYGVTVVGRIINDNGNVVTSPVNKSGMYQLQVRSISSLAVPFRLDVTYKAPRHYDNI